jgi:RNA polymerase sigma-B factor
VSATATSARRRIAARGTAIVRRPPATPSRAVRNSTRPEASPPAAEVAGCAVEEVVDALQAGDAYAPRSLDAPLQTDQDAGATELDRVPDRRAELARSENATALWQLGQVLDERSWEVVRLRFQEDLLQREIAERVGCSQMHVSRILRDAIARLHQAADEAGVVFD